MNDALAKAKLSECRNSSRACGMSEAVQKHDVTDMLGCIQDYETGKQRRLGKLSFVGHSIGKARHLGCLTSWNYLLLC